VILQALYDYYDRKSTSGEIEPEGFSHKAIDFFLVLDRSGKYVDIECVQTQEGKRRFGLSCRVPAIGKQVEKHTNAGNDANLLWDNAGFVFGLGAKGGVKLASFIETIERYYPDPPDDVSVVLSFLKKEQKEKDPFLDVLNHPEFGEELQTGRPLVTFRLLHEKEPIIHMDHVASAVQGYGSRSERRGVCLVTGESGQEIERNHLASKGVPGAQSSGAYLVSFNQRSFCSYGKTQSYNAPVSKKAAAGYGKALNHLLSSGKNKTSLGDAIVLFWSAGDDNLYRLEDNFAWFFEESKDDPDLNVRAVKALYESPLSGKYSMDADNRFYVLGLAPNAGRLAVRLWRTGRIADFAAKIKLHFDDCEIVKSPGDPQYLSLGRMLRSLVIENKMANVPPNLAGRVIESVLDGSPYPQALLNLCINRIRADRTVSRARAAVIKAYTNRYRRLYRQINNIGEVRMSLDKNNTDESYLLGRLFAILEKIQEEASPGINATIRDRFYGAASTSPGTVFSKLLSLKNHHLAKLENTGRKVNFEKQIGEVMDGLKLFPLHLSLMQQGMFAVGYYHQRQDFFISKKGNE